MLIKKILLKKKKKKKAANHLGPWPHPHDLI